MDTAADTFRAAMNDAPPPPNDAPAERPDIFADEPSPSLDNPPQAEQPKADKPKEPEAPLAPKEPSSEVPEWRRAEIRAQREEERRQREAERAELADLRRRLAEREDAEKPAPDLYESPDQFVDHRLGQKLSPIERQLQEFNQRAEQRFLMSDYDRAVDKHGEDKVQEALQAASAVPGLVQRLLADPRSPHTALMRWSNGQRMFREFGDDPEAARKKIEDDARKRWLDDPEFQAQVLERHRSGARNVVEPPRPAGATVTPIPSMNRTTGASMDDEPDDPVDAFRQAARPRRAG